MMTMNKINVNKLSVNKTVFSTCWIGNNNGITLNNIVIF